MTAPPTCSEAESRAEVERLKMQIAMMESGKYGLKHMTAQIMDLEEQLRLAMAFVESMRPSVEAAHRDDGRGYTDQWVLLAAIDAHQSGLE